MKRLIPAAIIVAIIIIICALSDAYVQRSINSSKAQIEECERLYMQNRKDEAAIKAKQFKSSWKKTSEKISAFINHHALDDIGTLAAVLPDTIAANSDFEFASTLSRIRSTLDLIYHEQVFTLDNLY